MPLRAKRHIKRNCQSHGDPRMNDARRTASAIMNADDRRIISSICYDRDYRQDTEQEIQSFQIRIVSEGRLRQFREAMAGDHHPLQEGVIDLPLREKRFRAVAAALGFHAPLDIPTAEEVNMVLADIHDTVLQLRGVMWAADETGGHDLAIPRDGNGAA